jgi:MFS family permease
MVVVSVLVMAAALRAIPLRRPEAKARAFDPVGATIIAAGTLTFLMACTRGPAWGWTHPATIGLAVASVLLLPVFVVFQLRHRAPTLDPRLFGSVVFSSAAVSAILNYVTLFLAIYLLPFALRDGQQMQASTVGRVLAAQAAGMALFAFGSGWLSDRVGSRGLAAGGMLVTALGMLGLSLSWPTSGVVVPMAWLFVCGAGTGVFISPNSSALMGAAPKTQQGSAGGVMGLSRTLGMTLGVALASGLFATVFPQGRVLGWPVAADGVVRLGLQLGAGCALLAAVVSWLGHAKAR